MNYDSDELSPFDTTVHIFRERCERFAFEIKRMTDSGYTFNEIDEVFKNGVKALTIMLFHFQNLEFNTCERIFRICFDLAFNILHNLHKR